jgi:hypothetical protein
MCIWHKNATAAVDSYRLCRRFSATICNSAEINTRKFQGIAVFLAALCTKISLTTKPKTEREKLQRENERKTIHIFIP